MTARPRWLREYGGRGPVRRTFRQMMRDIGRRSNAFTEAIREAMQAEGLDEEAVVRVMNRAWFGNPEGKLGRVVVLPPQETGARQ